jgi:hypothetical protein
MKAWWNTFSASKGHLNKAGIYHNITYTKAIYHRFYRHKPSLPNPLQM